MHIAEVLKLPLQRNPLGSMARRDVPSNQRPNGRLLKLVTLRFRGLKSQDLMLARQSSDSQPVYPTG